MRHASTILRKLIGLSQLDPPEITRSRLPPILTPDNLQRDPRAYMVFPSVFGSRNMRQRHKVTYWDCSHANVSCLLLSINWTWQENGCVHKEMEFETLEIGIWKPLNTAVNSQPVLPIQRWKKILQNIKTKAPVNENLALQSVGLFIWDTGWRKGSDWNSRYYNLHPLTLLFFYTLFFFPWSIEDRPSYKYRL